MIASLATEKDIQALPYNGPSPYKTNPSYQGVWSAGAIHVKTHAHLCINKQPVVYQAECTFTFNGTDTSANGRPVKEEETITLKAKPTLLQVEGIQGKTYVLCHLNNEVSLNGNVLKVESHHILKTE